VSVTVTLNIYLHVYFAYVAIRIQFNKYTTFQNLVYLSVGTDKQFFPYVLEMDKLSNR
jgi:hypothetical protein